jgi:hypothetical protein
MALVACHLNLNNEAGVVDGLASFYGLMPVRAAIDALDLILFV